MYCLVNNLGHCALYKLGHSIKHVLLCNVSLIRFKITFPAKTQNFFFLGSIPKKTLVISFGRAKTSIYLPDFLSFDLFTLGKFPSWELFIDQLNEIHSLPFHFWDFFCCFFVSFMHTLDPNCIQPQ